METKVLHVKKLENPDFSNLNYKGKNLMTYRKSNLIGIPPIIHIGQIKQSSGNENNLYLDGFTMADSSLWFSELEKQTILEGNYCGRRPHYEMPLTNVTSEKDIFYEFKDEARIDELRDICDGKEKKLVIMEDK